jgi:hypothetical protein
MAKLCLSKIIIKVTIVIITFRGFTACVVQMMVVCVFTSCYMNSFRHFGERAASICTVTEFASSSSFGI